MKRAIEQCLNGWNSLKNKPIIIFQRSRQLRSIFRPKYVKYFKNARTAESLNLKLPSIFYDSYTDHLGKESIKKPPIKTSKMAGFIWRYNEKPNHFSPATMNDFILGSKWMIMIIHLNEFITLTAANFYSGLLVKEEPKPLSD